MDNEQLREAFAQHAGKDAAEIGSFAIVFESQNGDTVNLHTVWSDAPFSHMSGMIRELEYQIEQLRMRTDAREQIQQFMEADNDGEV